MIALLKDAKVRYSTFDILEDDEVRQGETIQKQASLFYFFFLSLLASLILEHYAYSVEL